VARSPLKKLTTVRRLMQYHARSHGVAPRRQMTEMTRLWIRNGIGPLEYYLLGLFRPSVPWQQKLDTVSGRTFWKQINIINPRYLRSVATNKVASYGMLRAFGIPTPQIHGVIGPDGQSTDGQPLRNADDLVALVERRRLRDVCFKPLSAWSGRGFLKVRIEDGAATIQPGGPTLTLDALCSERLVRSGHGSHLIQDVLEQHPDIARFHPHSLNTLRVWMFQRRPGHWEMGPGNLRIGVGGSTVDNTSAGGIGAVVDIDSGRLGPAILRGLDPDNGVMLEEFPAHPTTGVAIEGAVLPMWDETRALCERACAVFPFFRLMGLDVAFGVEKPWIIEVEADPHSMIQVYTGQGIGPILEELARGAT
jgi:hypothetical protein